MTTDGPVKRGRIVELDFIRGIAILMVMGRHFYLPLVPYPLLNAIRDRFWLSGRSGVDLFFVLSGFLVGGLLLKEYAETGAIQPGRFLLRRGMKIWPAYYVMLLFHVVVRRHPLSTFLVANLLHLQNYMGTSIVPTWTLSIEEHFYLFLAFLLAWAARKRMQANSLLGLLGGLCVAAAGSRMVTLYVMKNRDGALMWTHNRLDSLMFGVIVAVVYHLKPELFERIASRTAALAALSVAGVCWLLLVPDQSALMLGPGFTVLYVCFSALLILAYRHSAGIRNIAPYRWVAWLGVYSYNLYLWNTVVRPPVEKITHHFPVPLQWPAALFLQTAAAAILAVIMTRLVEWPVLRWRDRKFGASRGIRNTADADTRIPEPVMVETGV